MLNVSNDKLLELAEEINEMIVQQTLQSDEFNAVFNQGRSMVIDLFRNGASVVQKNFL